MGRTEPSIGRPPAAFRRDARAKQARATLNKIIPSMLSNHPRARQGIEASELIVPPIANARQPGECKRGAESLEPHAGPRLTIRATDTLTAARSFITNPSNTTKKVAILNMASPLSPGGGFVNGATSQEEHLCMRTTLLPALRDEFYRLPEVGCVYTPDVLVFRSGDSDGQDGVLDKKDRWFVDVVSAAMLRLPETQVDEETGRGEYAQAKDRELVILKMKTVMEVLNSKGIAKIVLGAWGCGAYGNPIGEIARAWRKVLATNKGNKARKKKKSDIMRESWYGFDEVVFAIKDHGMAEAFQSAFGDGLEWSDEDVGETESQYGEVAFEDDKGQVEELIRRMDELRIRIDRSTNPQVKAGLEAVMEGLQKQLPGERENEGSQDDADDDDSE
ncbi:hypothetical protein N0V82_002432 [Gnomoniopsis sp. IMI 355080]|nr:hypothetical protein N0V82_002432 [Gnomoniopsis sp. IMI 355080]